MFAVVFCVTNNMKDLKIWFENKDGETDVKADRFQIRDWKGRNLSRLPSF